MWIKSASIFGIKPKLVLSLNEIENRTFTPVGSHELSSHGWSEVFEGRREFTMSNQVLLNFSLEKKIIPSSAIKARLDARLDAFEKAEGFRPGKKMTKELKERIVDEMLPTAFPSRSTTKVWIDGEKNRLVIDSTSNALVDLIIKELLKTFGDLGIEDMKWPRQAVVTEWLLNEPVGFQLEDEVTLQYPGERGKRVAFTKADLGTPDVNLHVQKGGASVTSLAMTFDDRISFVMTPDMQLRRIKPLDILTSAIDSKDVDAFTSEFALMTMELRSLITDLTEQ